MRSSFWWKRRSRAITVLTLVLASACSDSTPQPRVADQCPECTPAEVNDDSAAPLVCGPGQPDARVDPASGLVPAWRVNLGAGEDLASAEAADSVIVAKKRNGRTVTLDAETGGECAELVAARESGRTSVIDAYNPRARVVHGVLVGSSKQSLSAIGIRTGAVRWTRALLPPSLRGDEYALTNSLKVLATSTAIVVGANASDGREVVVAIDPRTGMDLWSKIVVERRSHDEGDVMLATDGARVFVRTNGTLTAYEANGTSTWSTSWAPAGALPLVAADSKYVAIAFDGRVQVVDGSTGAGVGEVAIPGTPTELIAKDGYLFAAAETKSGTVTVLAIDLATGGVRWSFDSAYSARSLRVDDDLVYVLDGNRRVWGLERATGARRFGLGTGASDFAVARPRRGTPRIIAASSGVVAFDATGAEPLPLEPFPRWLFAAESSGSYENCSLRALSWDDGNGRSLWQRDVPARMREIRFPCRSLEGYRREARFVGRLPYSMFGTSVNDGTLVEANRTGVLALNLRDGSVQLDAAAPGSERGVSFYQGTFAVDGLSDCKGVTYGAELFMRCGDRYVYFNGTTALVLSGTPLRVEATGTYASDAIEEYIADQHAFHVRAVVTAGAYVFRLEGTQPVPD
ncbi:PQQ-binding-like beta-propeller repeat protein [Pendulispora rubella]|uniref:PQQ-binding-like beta-propeller repeat protein n=1 Tax=Pendulispora rubella TaxID=2741070 RepID=A0ABZ2L1G2_9BACT